MEYTLSHRTADTPLEVAIAGHTTGEDPSADREHVASYKEAGANWWLEDLSPFSFGWQWDGDWPLDRMQTRVRSGPPRLEE